ncbi:hypothetical protein FB451DRAFT_1286171 [Mycena latifolia]|nr:hypothetical protein FB451DRAFT_1286171 [Mycena latifolia]
MMRSSSTTACARMCLTTSRLSLPPTSRSARRCGCKSVPFAHLPHIRHVRCTVRGHHSTPFPFPLPSMPYNVVAHADALIAYYHPAAPPFLTAPLARSPAAEPPRPYAAPYTDPLSSKFRVPSLGSTIRSVLSPRSALWSPSPAAPVVVAPAISPTDLQMFTLV